MSSSITSVPGIPPDGTTIVSTSGSLTAQEVCTRQAAITNQSTASTSYQNASAGTLTTPAAMFTGQKCLIEVWGSGGCTAGSFDVKLWNTTDLQDIAVDAGTMGTTEQAFVLQGVITLGNAGTTKLVRLQFKNSGAGTSNLRRYYLKATLVQA